MRRKSSLLLICLLILSWAATAQEVLKLEDITPEMRARSQELERLYFEEVPRWGERIRSGQGSFEAAQMATRGIKEKDPAVIEQALELTRKVGDRYGEGHVLAYQALYTALVVDERISKWEQCLERFDGIANPLLCAHARLMVGGVRLEDRNLILSLEHFQKALPVFESLGPKDLEAESCLGLGTSLANLGRTAESLPYLTRAVLLYKETLAAPSLARAEFVLGFTLVSLTRFAEAEEALRSSRERYRQMGAIPSMLANDLYINFRALI